MRSFDSFAEYNDWLERAVEDALARNDTRKLAKAAQQFKNAYSLPGYSLKAQVDWFAKKLGDSRFAVSGCAFHFGIDFVVESELLDDASRQVLSSAYLASLVNLKDSADLVSAMEFLVQHQSPERALLCIERDLLPLAGEENRLQEFVYDGLRMFSSRQDLSAQQLARARELADPRRRWRVPQGRPNDQS